MLPPHSLFLLLLPLLSSSSLPPPQTPRYPTVVVALTVPLTTTATANLATAVAEIFSYCQRVALSCRVSLAIVLTAVVVASHPLLPLLLLPHCPHPGPCCGLRCHRCCLTTPIPTAANTAIPRCCRHVAPALAAFTVILAAAVLPSLLLMLPLKLTFWLIVMFPQPLTLSPLAALLLSLMLIVGCSSSSS